MSSVNTCCVHELCVTNVAVWMNCYLAGTHQYRNRKAIISTMMTMAMMPHMKD